MPTDHASVTAGADNPSQAVGGFGLQPSRTPQSPSSAGAAVRANRPGEK